jgi:hypothetical protein
MLGLEGSSGALPMRRISFRHQQPQHEHGNQGDCGEAQKSRGPAKARGHKS